MHLKSKLTICCLLILAYQGFGQLYFPPLAGNTWNTTTPAEQGWDVSKLEDLKTYLTSVDTKAFIILKDGKIAVEYYLNGHSQDMPWYWASAGKSLTSMIIATAEGEGKLKLSDPSSKHIGAGWTSMETAKENAITVRHHVTMTTGLDDTNGDCTDPECLKYKAIPGTRWSYHNAPYTLCDKIIEGATGQTINTYFKDKIGSKTGINGQFIKSGYNNVFVSKARDMARFGLLALANGNWNGQDIIKNPSYVEAMSKSSQTINPAYGYLWWLNGKGTYMLPGSQFVFAGLLIPNAPSDMFSALGKNDQKVYVIPSQNMVIIRLGEVATDDGNPVPVKFDNALWAKLAPIFNFPSSTSSELIQPTDVVHHSQGNIVISEQIDLKRVSIFNISGEKMGTWRDQHVIDASNWSKGLYFVRIITTTGEKLTRKIIVI